MLRDLVISLGWLGLREREGKGREGKGRGDDDIYVCTVRYEKQ
jgi:hypothetical protein